MYKFALVFGLTLSLGFELALARTGRIVEERTIEEKIALESRGTFTIVVDNVFGAIRVTGHDRPFVEIVAEETVRARSRAAFDRARSEVWLDVRRDGDEVLAVVEGPFRDRRNDRDWEGYVVEYDFDIRVPRDSHLELKTVNDGGIEVEEVHGHFRVSNVNGGISLDGAVGPGSATTVNGPIDIRFDENPDGDCEFRTVNGDLELTFQPDLSADLFFKTFNGEARTDFDIEPLASAPESSVIDGGKRVIRSSRWSGVRVDRGGPELRFDTLNGDILIRNARRTGRSR